MTTLRHLLPHIALHPDGEHLCLAPELSTADVDLIAENKAWVLDQLRQTQIDYAGFYCVLPDVLEREIRAAPAVVIFVEVTAATRYGPAERLGAYTKIGEHAGVRYRALHPGVRASSAPRVRALSVHLDGLGFCCFDWDRMPVDDKSRLLRALFAGKLVIGHNLAGQMSWLFAETDARPAYIANTQLLVHHIKPNVLLRPFARAASSDPGVSAAAAALISQHGGRARTTLEYVARSIGLSAPIPEFRTAASWAVSVLSGSHIRSSACKLSSVVAIFVDLFPSGIAGASVRDIEAAAPFYRH